MQEEVIFEGDYESWLTTAKQLAAAGHSDQSLRFVPSGSLFAKRSIAVPPLSLDSATDLPWNQLAQYFRYLASHNDENRWQTMWELVHLAASGGKDALTDACHVSVQQARALEQDLKYEQHKMKAYLRFRKEIRDDEEWYGSIYPCRFDLLPWTANWFVDRFRGMRWYIECHGRLAVWDKERLSWQRNERSDKSTTEADVCENLWLTYYKSTYNPARHNSKLVRQHIPKRFWSHLTEGQELQRILHTANDFQEGLAEAANAPATELARGCNSIAELRVALDGCSACELRTIATQVVPGEGPDQAELMIIGEQPGDKEDEAGRPFIGPAGSLLRELLQELALPLDAIYLTNAVKHFNHVVTDTPGKPRLHNRPSQTQVNQCRGWLLKEIELIRPKLILCLGTTALRAVLGRNLAIEEARLQTFRVFDTPVRASFHPAAILRTAAEKQARFRKALKSDLYDAGNFCLAPTL